MARFKARELDVLVATTVIEVGVDVPNATVMIVQEADRFGLAQLHQLRGRVGRGAEQSYCLLVSRAKEELTETAQQRLEALVATTDGFELAEVDLDLRGGGQLLGTRQHGATDLHFAHIRRDRPLLERARDAARELAGAAGPLAGRGRRALRRDGPGRAGLTYPFHGPAQLSRRRRGGAVRAARLPPPLAYVTADTESHVVVVDLSTGAVRNRIATRPDPRSVERVGDVAVVAHTAVGAGQRRPRARRAARARGFEEPRYTAAARDGRHAFVTDSGRVELLTVDVARGEIVGR